MAITTGIPLPRLIRQPSQSFLSLFHPLDPDLRPKGRRPGVGGRGRKLVFSKITMSTCSKPEPVRVYDNADKEKELIISENKGRAGIYR